MNQKEGKDIAHSFFENANKGNMEASMELLSDSLVWTGVGSTR
jgi:hypothetical protein